MRTPDEQEQFLHEGRFQQTSYEKRPGRRWPLWLLLLLFPIPFSPWWLTILCWLVFGALAWAYLLTRTRGA